MTSNENSPSTAQWIAQAKREYQKTLDHFRIRRKVGQFDETEIGRAVQKYGGEFVCLAIRGARRERGGDRFDPQQHLSMRRIADPENIERFANLGAFQEERDPEIEAINRGEHHE